MNAPSGGLHLATVAHGGHIWDAYLEFADDPHRPDSYRARIRFDSPHGGEADGAYRTGVIIIEPSYEEALMKARSFDDRQLQGMLRSVLPEEGDDTGDSPA